MATNLCLYNVFFFVCGGGPTVSVDVQLMCRQGFYAKLLLFLKKKVCNLHLTKDQENETEKRIERNGEKIFLISWRDKNQATWITEQMKVEDVLKTFWKKNWIWTDHIMQRTDNRSTNRVTK